MTTTAALPLIRLAPGRDRRIKGGHPWAFSNEIVMTATAKALPPGSVVQLVGDDGIGHGLWHFNPHSLIAARRLDSDAQARIDAEWFRDRLAEALALRQRLFDAPYYRLVHAEADGLPGLIIDRYGEALALQANTAGMEGALPLIVDALVALLRPRLIVARNDTPVRRLEGLPEETRILYGTPSEAMVEENGLRFPVDLLGGQKTGWFYDQREHRARLARLAKGCEVLDAFCHTGGFGIACAAAGARRVILLDRSAPALALAARAAAINGVEGRIEICRAEALAALERWRDEGRRFDMVICDPPAFARTRKDLPAARRAYAKLAACAAAVVAPGGWLFLASCSYHLSVAAFLEALAQGLRRARRQARVLHCGGAGPDHPLHPLLPESGYLKAALLAVG